MARPVATNRAGIRKLLEAKLLAVTQKLTMEADARLKLASPVDDGEFRAAWTAQSPTKPYEKGIVGNNTEYAVPLANGHSPQAPAGWIENELTAVVKGN
ncbi:hypothetical protein QP179_03250 [Sphingomonas aurantiaca]|uniref:hypothetical protein n=1 Tax=Sphingomonas aurantiaca TaxID=185949 RepID=UPI002FE01006